MTVETPGSIFWKPKNPRCHPRQMFLHLEKIRKNHHFHLKTISNNLKNIWKRKNMEITDMVLKYLVFHVFHIFHIFQISQNISFKKIISYQAISERKTRWIGYRRGTKTSRPTSTSPTNGRRSSRFLPRFSPLTSPEKKGNLRGRYSII